MNLRDAIKGAGSGARGAKFEKIGTVVGGKVISAELIQDRDDDGQPATWDDGNPKQKIRVIVQTKLDEGDDDQGRPDDGKRAIYIKWWGAQRKNFLAAMEKSGADDVLPGGDFFAKYKADGEKVKKAWSAPKEMAYKYVAPAVVPNDGFDEDEEPAEPAAKPARPAATPAKAAAKPKAKPAPVEDDLADTADPVDDTASALAEAGLDDDF